MRYDKDADRILNEAKYNALDEILARGSAIGRAIERCAPSEEIDTLPGVFAAVDAYYVVRHAYEVNNDTESW
jgi:hypothetical protein